MESSQLPCDFHGGNISLLSSDALLCPPPEDEGGLETPPSSLYLQQGDKTQDTLKATMMMIGQS